MMNPEFGWGKVSYRAVVEHVNMALGRGVVEIAPHVLYYFRGPPSNAECRHHSHSFLISFEARAALEVPGLRIGAASGPGVEGG